jgi:tRNA(fMet)-specific endonuclease VapC
MSYLLDTDTFSMIAKQRSDAAERRLHALAEGDVAISVITWAEVQFGLALNPLHARVLRRIEALASVVRALPIGLDVVPHYARLRALLLRKGTPIGPNDLWLAAHALSANLTLVTGNEREFRRVPKLRVENWLQ